MIVNVELSLHGMLSNFSARDCQCAAEVGDHQGRVWFFISFHFELFIQENPFSCKV